MEYLDIVNEADQVVGRASKEDIYAQKLWHRIVHVLIFNEHGEIALQLRSRECSYCPLHWSTSVGGHVQSGETYEAAALREYREELGVNSHLEPVEKILFTTNHGLKKFLLVFRTIYTGAFAPRPQEVEQVAFFSKNKIQDMIRAGEKFHPELLFILQKENIF